MYMFCHIYIHLHVYICVYVCLCMCICMHACIHVCVLVILCFLPSKCLYIYTDMHNSYWHRQSEVTTTREACGRRGCCSAKIQRNVWYHVYHCKRGRIEVSVEWFDTWIASPMSLRRSPDWSLWASMYWCTTFMVFLLKKFCLLNFFLMSLPYIDPNLADTN